VAVDGSISRLMPKVTTPEHQKRARRLRELLAHHEENRDLVAVGAYRKGSDPLLDQAIARIGAIESMLYHGTDTRPAADTAKLLQQIAGA
jgi:flagellar biosynthesis/type III secretory pathway ATPase